MGKNENTLENKNIQESIEKTPPKIEEKEENLIQTKQEEKTPLKTQENGENSKKEHKNKKFRVKEGVGSVGIDGNIYNEGDEVEITEKRAKEIGIYNLLI